MCNEQVGPGLIAKALPLADRDPSEWWQCYNTNDVIVSYNGLEVARYCRDYYLGTKYQAPPDEKAPNAYNYWKCVPA